MKTRVIGCPKTIDGDLKSKEVPTSFGFDTACKVNLTWISKKHHLVMSFPSKNLLMALYHYIHADILGNDWKCYDRCTFHWKILPL